MPSRQVAGTPSRAPPRPDWGARSTRSPRDVASATRRRAGDEVSSRFRCLGREASARTGCRRARWRERRGERSASCPRDIASATRRRAGVDVSSRVRCLGAEAQAKSGCRRLRRRETPGRAKHRARPHAREASRLRRDDVRETSFRRVCGVSAQRRRRGADAIASGGGKPRAARSTERAAPRSAPSPRDVASATRRRAGDVVSSRLRCFGGEGGARSGCRRLVALSRAEKDGLRVRRPRRPRRRSPR